MQRELNDNAESASLLDVRDLTRTFGQKKSRLVAVNQVSLQLSRQETLGIVGESGSGKSTLARMIAGLLTPDSGQVSIDGQNISTMKRKELWRQIQMVPQDSWGSLNPALSVRTIVAEPFRFYGKQSWRDACAHADRLLEEVGLDPGLGSRSPTDISGGQRQRVAIARALAVEPRILVCDESTSALDVSVQAQILALLERLREVHSFSMLFVSHDIGVVRYIADEVLVMKDGDAVEQVRGRDLHSSRVNHEYTAKLLAAVPELKYSAPNALTESSSRGV